MKAILKFDLPEENAEHQMALDGWKYRAVLSELERWLEEENERDGNGITLKARDRLFAICEEYGVTIYD